MHTAQPDLSVLIVCFNEGQLVNECLASLAQTVQRHTYEVIVADNASRDGSVDLLRRAWPEMRIVEMGGNLGFPRAVNRAFSESRGRYALLLNADTVALPGALDELVDFLEANPLAGVAAPNLLNTDLTDQGTARSFPSPAVVLFGRKSFLTRRFPRNPWSRRYLIGRDHRGDEPFRVDWVSGACLMTRREAVEQVGLMDEAIFVYWEDTDWCRRFGKAGYGVYCVPRAKVIHHEGQNLRRRRPYLIWAFHKSAYHYFAKHEAPQPWNPMRPIAAVALAARAALLIGMDMLVYSVALQRISRSLSRQKSR